MSRSRHSFAPFVPLLLVVLAATAVSDGARPPSTVGLVASVAWPPSTGLVIAEVVTGGASASDEYVELANGGSASVDLAGLELVYVSSSGATVTKKVGWTSSAVVPAGARFLVANAGGAFAAAADALYSSGIAAAGGAIVLRATGGAPVDAVGWGDAVNAYVEGTAAGAPPAGQSIERRIDSDGRPQDTNDNAADWVVQATPRPDGLTAWTESSPSPSPSPEPSMAPSTEPSASPSPTAAAEPSTPSSGEPSTSAAPSSERLPDVTGSPSAIPTESATPEASPSSSPSPSAGTSAAPEASPAAPLTDDPTISEVRESADGTAVSTVGTLTTPLGALEAGRLAYLEDASAGIGLYLGARVVSPLPAGTRVRLSGLVDQRYAGRVIRANEAAIAVLETTVALPTPLTVATGGLDEDSEGRRATMTGTAATAAAAVADGWSLTIDDGSGPGRVIVTVDALAGRSIVRGSVVTATGPVAQHDTSGTGTSGYRLVVTQAADLLVAPPAPVATASPEPSTDAVADGDLTLVDDAADELPGSQIPLVSISAARGTAIGTRVRIAGTVTAAPGTLASSLGAIQDAGGAIALHVGPDVVGLAPGMTVDVVGRIAQSYGQLELRAESGGLTFTGSAGLPDPLSISIVDVGEALEGRLVALDGTVALRPSLNRSGDVSFAIADGQARVRVVGRAPTGVTTSSVTPGARLSVVGIVGQRASASGRLDGYRIFVRAPTDVAQAPVEETGGTADLTSARPASPPAMSIAAAERLRDVVVDVVGVVTMPATVLDSSGRRIVVQDAGGAIEVLLPKGSAAPAVGSRVALHGTVVRAYGAPRIRATRFLLEGTGAVEPSTLTSTPPAADEWRLVRATGRLVALRRTATRWTAELEVGSIRLPVVALARAGIAPPDVSGLPSATVVGVVRRPLPTATDRRFAIVLRTPADLTVSGGLEARATANATDGAAGSSGSQTAPPVAGIPDVDLVELEGHIGEAVRVGGIVRSIDAAGIALDDGTGIGRVTFAAPAGGVLGILTVGEPIAVVGSVVADAGRAVVRVSDAAAVDRVGALGDATPLVSPIPAAAGPLDAVAAQPDCRLDPCPSGLVAGDLDLVGRESVSRTGAGPLATLPALAALAGLGIPSVVLAGLAVRRRRARARLAEVVRGRLRDLTESAS